MIKRKLPICCRHCGKFHINAYRPIVRMEFDWKCPRCKQKNLIVLTEKDNKTIK